MTRQIRGGETYIGTNNVGNINVTMAYANLSVTRLSELTT